MPFVAGVDSATHSRTEVVRDARELVRHGREPRAWDRGKPVVYAGDPVPAVRERYAEAREAVLDRC